MKRSSIGLSLAAAALLAGACATHNQTDSASHPPAPPPVPSTPVAVAQPPAPTAPATAARPPGTSRRPVERRLSGGVHWLRSSAEYRAIAISAYHAAAEAVTEAANGKAPDTWAVVLDADETVLDNSVFQRDLDRSGQTFTEELWAAFVRRRSAVPVPGALAFLNQVKRLGGRIAIVTNRFENLCEDTRANLRSQHLPFDVILCRVDVGDKGPRRAAVTNGEAFGDGKYREVVAYLGDNILDFPGVEQSLRDEPESALGEFGRRFFVIPNPMYGSWQRVPER